MDFSQEEKIRYARQTILPMIGLKGQQKLKAARVLFVGAGGLGSSPAIYLAAAGVGTIGLIDADTVSLSNLHRQVLHYTSDIDRPKVISAQEKLKQINPHVRVVTYQERFSAANALAVGAEYDVIIDGTDNLPSRYLMNDASFFLKKPLVFGGVFQFEGQVSVFGPGGPCYRCFFRELPPRDEMPSCAQAGVIGVVPGVIGLLQANEAIKMICGIGDSLLGRLLIFDALAACFREVKIKKDPACPLCGSHPTIQTLKEEAWEECPTKDENMIEEISVQELKRLRDKNPDLYLLDVREKDEWETARIEGAHLKPLSTFEDNFKDIPKDRPVYCYCHMGGRSARVTQFLKAQGYSKVFNVKGGIHAWALEIDPAVEQY
ncbi:MAG: molybdopterin-synthase adenylyltransferase MoeB [Candidatus Omnitrophica bacterium]|nr:molybdopterin-synthase adenylyltransferase MoeB [Candidatus Omnitrophota bacterium]MDE2010425.1 molybdopterin-synthase adenylyltransferase MoeB [Candidatus Omnitrophota bacterium]MDE2215447.1 molybdopterin-synthase adenylyltransferase MoeB [Candidatus Omnitrophota bacterium]